jgi:hypothetical protein
MAEIRVDNDNNKNRSIWPWILGALLLIGLIWGVSALTDDNEMQEANQVETIDDREVRPVEQEPVSNEQYENDAMMEDETMRNDRMQDNTNMQEDGTMMEDETMNNERVRDDALIEDNQ